MRYAASLFSSSALLALALLGGCARQQASSSSAASEEAPASGGLAQVEWTPAASPDSIAAWALAGCRGASDRGQCVEQALISVIQPAGVDKAMAALLRAVAADTTLRGDGHALAHGIGIAAYQGAGTVSRTFARCTTDFQSGCYHGVIQAYFADTAAAGQGVTADRLNALCADYRAPGNRWLLFQCGHGMGHGLMAVNQHHLIKALDGCDLLSEHFEREACYGGAFMENIINVTHPHHTATTRGGDAHAEHGAAQAGADGGHAHGEHASAGENASAGGHGHGDHGDAAAEPFQALDKEQPLYPCTIVEEQQLTSCYQMQTSAILWHNGGDFAAAAAECERAPESMRRTCFISLGRDANSYAAGDHDRVLALCGAAPSARQPWCFVGAVKNMMDITADPEDGLAFCRKVPGAGKPACYRGVGQTVWVLHADDAGRERACARAESGYVPECRAGALLPLVRSGD